MRPTHHQYKNVLWIEKVFEFRFLDSINDSWLQVDQTGPWDVVIVIRLSTGETWEYGDYLIEKDIFSVFAILSEFL